MIFSLVPGLKTNVSNTLKLDQESPSNLISHKVCQIHQDSSSLRAPESTSSSPDETLLSTDSCCKDKTIKVLPKQEELFPDLIKQIKEPKRKSQSDFQITGPTDRLSFDRSRPSTPCRQPLDISQFRSPIQPINQPSQQTSTRSKGRAIPSLMKLSKVSLMESIP